MSNRPEQKHSFPLPTAWLAGSGVAALQILLDSGCSVPKTGQCAACGGCVLALAGLVGWACLDRNKRRGRESAV